LADGRVLTILGPWESKPEEDVISYESDLAKEMLGKKVGDEVSVGKIAAIEPWR
jgi:transcription elongation GreA/GreB family factor